MDPRDMFCCSNGQTVTGGGGDGNIPLQICSSLSRGEKHCHTMQAGRQRERTGGGGDFNREIKMCTHL